MHNVLVGQSCSFSCLSYTTLYKTLLEKCLDSPRSAERQGQDRYAASFVIENAKKVQNAAILKTVKKNCQNAWSKIMHFDRIEAISTKQK